jgi:hypothetical protein
MRSIQSTSGVEITDNEQSYEPSILVKLCRCEGDFADRLIGVRCRLRGNVYPVADRSPLCANLSSPGGQPADCWQLLRPGGASPSSGTRIDSIAAGRCASRRAYLPRGCVRLLLSTALIMAWRNSRSTEDSVGCGEELAPPLLIIISLNS